MALSKPRQCLIWKLANSEFTVSARFRVGRSTQNGRIIPFSERTPKIPISENNPRLQQNL
jgi:hypothetical protein